MQTAYVKNAFLGNFELNIFDTIFIFDLHYDIAQVSMDK